MSRRSRRFAGSPPGTQPVVALTRAGWANPAGLQRPGLQRVAYFLENGTLRREYWNVLDPTLASTTDQARSAHAREELHAPLPRCESQLAAAVAADHQLPGLRIAGAGAAQRPLAVEITIDTEDWGKIVRIIEIAA